MTSIAIVDDHPMVRQGLRTTFSAEMEWEVVGEAADGLAGLELIRGLRPEILVADIQMPGLSGLDMLRQVGQAAPFTRVIIFSMHTEDAYVRAALSAGVAGYVVKDAEASELVFAIRAALRGYRYLSPALFERTIDAYLRLEPVAGGVDWADMLTARERQVLVLAAQGLTNSEIGDRLSMSPRTAETHRGNLMRKLGLKGQIELAHFAYIHRLVEP